MAEEATDIGPDCCTMLLEESLAAHAALMAETKANGESAHSIVRHAAARKFNQEDPIEAAAAEIVLQPNTPRSFEHLTGKSIDPATGKPIGG
jgi:hypothetical protein